MSSIQRRENVKEKYNHPTILKIHDRLWGEIKNILPKEKKPLKTVGRTIIPYRKVIDGVVTDERNTAVGGIYADSVIPYYVVLQGDGSISTVNTDSSIFYRSLLDGTNIRPAILPCVESN